MIFMEILVFLLIRKIVCLLSTEKWSQSFSRLQLPECKASTSIMLILNTIVLYFLLLQYVKVCFTGREVIDNWDLYIWYIQLCICIFAMYLFV